MRLAARDDEALVTALTVAAYQEHTDLFGYAPVPVIEDYAPRIAQGEVWLREVEGNIVGLAVVERHVDHMMLFSLATSPEHRGAGHGIAMLKWIENLARQWPVPELRLYTNERMERNIALYSAFGFMETGRHAVTGPPARRIVNMSKDISG